MGFYNNAKEKQPANTMQTVFSNRKFINLQLKHLYQQPLHQDQNHEP